MALTQVSTGGIKDGQVQTADLADGQVTVGKLHADALDHTYTLGADGSNHYTFTGEGLTGAVNDPTLYLTRGKTYRFVNGNSAGAHPFRIQTTVNGSAGTEYNTGVTNNGGAGGSTIVFEVPHAAPDVLYYQCTSHGSMGGIFYITGALADGGVTTAKIADDAVTDAKLANSINSAIAANTAKVQTTINNNADNRVITGSGTANTLNGESNVVIDSSGNVGIGTTSPAGKVHINSAANTATFLAEGEIDNPQYPSYGFSGQNADNGDRGAGMYLPADSTLAFSTAGTEKVRIQNSGGISFNGDTATANALDDYEEGTWTPTASNFTINYNYSANYTKIGNVVYVQMYIVASSGSGVSAVTIGGLPYTVKAGNYYSYAAGRIGGSASQGYDKVFEFINSSTNVQPRAADGPINEGMISGQHLLMSGFYHTS